MFGIFKKDPVKKLQKQYEKVLEEATQLQRNGDIKSYALKMEVSEKIAQEIEKLKARS